MDSNPSPRKPDQHKAVNPSNSLQVPANTDGNRSSLSGRSALSGNTSYSQFKSRASTRQSGLTNASNWTALSATSNTSVKSSFYPPSGYPTTNPLSGTGYPTSGYPVGGFPGNSFGYPGVSFGYPASNFPGFPNFPCCDVPGVTGLQSSYPNSEFPTSAYPGEIEQSEDYQPYIGLYHLEAGVPGGYVPDQPGGYPVGDYAAYANNPETDNGFVEYGYRTYR